MNTAKSDGLRSEFTARGRVDRSWMCRWNVAQGAFGLSLSPWACLFKRLWPMIVLRLPFTLFSRTLAVFSRCLVGVVLLGVGLPATASGAGQDVASPHELDERRMIYEGEDGTTCSHFLGGVLEWERRGGDWRDARGRRFGDSSYADATPGTVGAIWDVTGLVRKWMEAGTRRGAMLLRTSSATGHATFYSREAKGPADWPMLVLEMAGARREMLKPTADTQLDCSTYTSLGRADKLQVMNGVNSVLEFLLPAGLSARKLTRAQLVLSNAAAPGGRDMRIGVFEMAAPEFPKSSVSYGLAADYPGDNGIERHPDVVYASGFDETWSWRSRWSKEAAGNFDVVREASGLRFEPLAGKALSVNVKKGDNYGADLRLYLKDLGGERDELYFRYYLRLADDWNPTLEGGKLPGLAGTYGKAGWGGRRSDGTNGWALQGAFFRAFASDHPMRGLNQMATYAYHADMQTDYGDHWIWPGALFQRNRWYCIEQHVRLNRPGAADGGIRVWIDGRLVMERSQVRLRTVERLHIETLWLNVWHGGVAKSPHDQHVFIDNIVLARRYIGPMVEKAPSAPVVGK